jgi:chromosome segregation ATPase
MKREPQQFWRSPAAACLLITVAVLANWLFPAAAQDIRGLEVCTSEKQMDRRTGCLQANIDFLQQELAKLARQTEDKLSAADRSLAAARAEIAALKSTVEKLSSELTRIKGKAAPDAKK